MNRILSVILILCVVSTAFAGKVEWDFSLATSNGGDLPVNPSVFDFPGELGDWILDGNADNYDQSFLAADVRGGFLHFLDDANVSGNVSLQTTDEAFFIRDDYALSGPGDQLWIQCDHQYLEYGKRANLEPGTVDRSRIQLFWFTFQTSNFTGLGLQYGAGNYNTEDFLYFTAIGNGDETQDDYLGETRLVEEGDAPNLERRIVTIRITENDDPFTVSVDVKYDGGSYRTIDPAYAGAITSYPGGNSGGDENLLLVIGNNSGSGAIEFNIHRLTISDEDPDGGGSSVDHWEILE